MTTTPVHVTVTLDTDKIADALKLAASRVEKAITTAAKYLPDTVPDEDREAIADGAEAISDLAESVAGWVAVESGGA